MDSEEIEFDCTNTCRRNNKEKDGRILFHLCPKKKNKNPIHSEMENSNQNQATYEKTDVFHNDRNNGDNIDHNDRATLTITKEKTKIKKEKKEILNKY